MSEKFDFKSLDLSKEPDQKKFDEEFGKLPENERKSLVEAAQEEAVDIDAKAKELAGKDKKPTARHYQEAAESLNVEMQDLISFIEDIEPINSKEIQACIDPKERIAKEIEAEKKAERYFIKFFKLKLEFKKKQYSDYVKTSMYKEFVFRMIKNGWVEFMDERWFKIFTNKDREDIYLKFIEIESERQSGYYFGCGYLIEKWGLNGLSSKVIKKLIQINEVRVNAGLPYQSFVTDNIIDNIDSFADKKTALFSALKFGRVPFRRLFLKKENLLALLSEEEMLELRDKAKEEMCDMSINNDKESIKHIDQLRDIYNININELAPNYPKGMKLSDVIEMARIPEIGKLLAYSLNKLKTFYLEDHIRPIINAQSNAAFLYFESIKKIPNFESLAPEDVEYITYIGKKYGTQARNILDNILSKIGVGNIGQEKDETEEYLSQVGIAHYDIYSQHKQAKMEGRPEKITELKERVTGLQDKTYKGEMEESDFQDSLYPAISYHTFPPAVGLTQDQYDKLNKNRLDRRNDVPEALDELQYQKFEVSTGKFTLGEGEELNLEKWTMLGEAVKKVNAELEKLQEAPPINKEEIAEHLIKMFKEKSAETPVNQAYLFESMYRYHLAHGGGKLETGFEISIEGLMKYKEFIGDRVKNDLIKDCLGKWRQSHESEFQELQKDILNRVKSAQNQNFAKVKNILIGVDKQKDQAKKEKAIQNLDDFLKDYGLSYENVKDQNVDDLSIELEAVLVEYDGDFTSYHDAREEYYNSPAFLRVYDEFMAKHDTEEIVYQKISSDLVAKTNRKMRKEVDKFKFKGETGKTRKQALELIISKKKEHGVAGYNMGVCVAPDAKLWNDPTFMNGIIFNPELKQAMGGMHFLIRENNLCLPGINPSLDVLGQVKNEELFDQMIEYAKQVKEKLGLDKVLIPVSSGIYSNRTQIQEIVRKKNFKKYSLKKEADFSYDPYKYSFQECFEVE